MFPNRMHLMVGVSVFALACSTGCRSGMSRMNLFGARSEPSAELLAGSGPTTTYPSPPSESATPQAIASIAAGTSGSKNDPITSPASGGSSETAQVAGLDIDPGYVAPASSSDPVTNMAAAQANGIFTGKTPNNYASATSKSPSAPSGYQYGSKSDNIKTAAAPPSTPSAYTKPVSTSPDSSYTAPNPSPTPKTSGGFTMPDEGVPAIANSAPKPRMESPPMLGQALPEAADTPEFRIATGEPSAPAVNSRTSSVPESSLPSSSIPALDTSAPASAPSTSTEGYSPGSTAGAVGYPASGGGSFYR